MSRRAARVGDDADPPRWRVTWQDWSRHHDWVGKGRKHEGLPTKKKSPPTQAREFTTEAAARNFCDELVEVCGRDNVVVNIASLRELLPPAPTQARFSDAWPYQRSRVRLC